VSGGRGMAEGSVAGSAAQIGLAKQSAATDAANGHPRITEVHFPKLEERKRKNPV